MKRSAFLLALLVASVMPIMAAPHGALMAAASPSASGSTVTLTWTGSITPGGTVNMYRCTGASCTNFAPLAAGIVAAGPYVDATVTAGLYSYQATALVNGAESLPSNTATVMVRPQPPTGLAGTTP